MLPDGSGIHPEGPLGFCFGRDRLSTALDCDRFVSPSPFVYEHREACRLADGGADFAMAAAEAQARRLLMEMTIRANSGVITLINIFAVNPENQQRLVAVLEEGTEAIMSKRAGYISASLHVSKDGRRVINYSQWKSVMDIEAMRLDPDVGPYMRRVANFGTFEAIACEVSYVHTGG